MRRQHWMSSLLAGILLITATGWLPAQHGIDSSEPPYQLAAEGPETLTVSFYQPFLLFSFHDEQVAAVRLLVRDGNGHLLYDSGERAGLEAGWDSQGWLDGEPLAYEIHGWDGEGNLIQRQGGEIRPAGGGVSPMVITAYDVAGNYTIGGMLGVGTSTPERAIHIKGSNAVFRMDRSRDTAAFMIVRNDDAGNILKTYVVGVNASGPNQGSFVINDLGQGTTGGGVNRLTIDNDGVAIFGKEVKATGFINTSSRQFKTNIRPLENALEKVMQMQGVAFDWKDTGAPSLGMIAEDVAKIAPEVVALGPDGQPAGIDYGRVSALLVESVKTQQREIEQLQKDCDELEAKLEKEIQALKNKRK